MKKLLSIFAITLALTACGKTESDTVVPAATAPAVAPAPAADASAPAATPAPTEK